MVMQPHVLHVYDKPMLGTQFLKSYPALRYKHRILATGGFDTASCILPVGRAEAETIFENMVGNRAAVFVDNPCEPIWEGLISRVTLTLPGIVWTRSLDEMGNRTRYTFTSGTGGSPALQPTTVQSLPSQAIYGIKTVVLRAARQQSATSYGTSLVARALNDLAYPLTSVAVNDGAVDAILSLELKGFYHTLDWEESPYAGTFTFSNGTTGHIDEMLDNLLNGTTFLDNQDTTDITANATQYTSVSEGGTVWNKMQMCAECGQAGAPARWVVGVTPYDWNTGTRRLYYRPADTSIKYLAKVNVPGQVFTPTGVRVLPWAVKPDGIVKVADALVGWDGDGFDPRRIYISALEYDAEAGKVSWQSDDNIQIQGALQTANWHSASGQKYAQRASNPLM